MTDLDQISGDVVNLSLGLNRALEPGLRESAHETALAQNLVDLGDKVDRQLPVGIDFEGTRFSAAFRVDINVDNSLLVEIESIERLNAAHAFAARVNQPDGE